VKEKNRFLCLPLTALLLCLFSPALQAAVSIDAQVSKDQGTANTTVASPAFSTVSGNELLLAFISSDGVSSPNTTVVSVTTSGLTWVLVQRTNVQLGSAEIWRAFATSPLTSVTATATLSQNVASSITVVSFMGVDPSGLNGLGAIGAVGSGNANTGAPAAQLVTTRAGSLVLGVGNDWDSGISRNLGAGQTLVHEYLAPIGDTYWVQRQTNPSAASGTTVLINDTAPTGDRYNLAIVEVLPATGTGGPTFTVFGSISSSTNGSGASVALSQNGTTISTVTADSSGAYMFPGVANGTYTVTLAKPGFTFNPSSQTAVVNGSNVSVPAFTATPTSGGISGTVTPAASGTGTTITLSLNSTTIATAAVDSLGNYSFSNIANNTYVVTPSKTGFTFSPSSQSVSLNGGSATVPPFTATATSGSISGTVTPSASGSGATITLSQNSVTIATATVSSTGGYTLSNVTNGVYVVTPSKSGFSFAPPNQSATVNGGVATVPAFTASALPTWSISGTLTPVASGTNATVTLTSGGTTVGSAVVSGTGTYTFSALSNGGYVVTPSKPGFTFTPANQTVVVNGANASVPAFTATGTPPILLFPDLRDIIPPGGISIVGAGSSRVFQYTHDTFNGGPGPLVIQPLFNSASGNYQGTQYIYSQNSSGVWSLSSQIPLAGVFIFDSDHGHFHFPFVTYGLYTVAANGGPGTPVVTSGKISFCINDSFIYDSTLPNAGALGNLGSCSDPTSLRGLDIGAVDEYDQTDAGQSISIGSLPDGTYWLKALVDPNNFLAEADKTNNETDVELTITGNTVQVLKTVIPVLNQPPAITLTAPVGGGTVSRSVQLTATTGTGNGVQFLIDGQPFGSVVSGSPATLPWDTTTVPNGTHWLAAQTTDSTGITGTSPVVIVTVSNVANTAPVVQLTSPANGSILSSTVTLYATVASSQPIASVSFFVDFASVGSPVTAPPYMIPWDSTTVADGQHVISVSATDTLGNVGNSTPVTLNVNNSHPANLIGKDVTVSVDGSGTLTTPVFSTTTIGDLLVAFVSYDGPSNSPQTAVVTGAGLTWTLLMRSNTQFGTSEIWSARVDGVVTGVTVTSSPGLGSSYHGSLTVIGFTNAAGTSVVGRTGAPSGAPDIPLPGVISGDWVFAVGNDWDNAIARTPLAGQVLVHQKVDTNVGDTYWVQSTTTPSTANAVVDIHDSAPTTDQWNYAAVEIVAAHQ
jgi:hypothetical protein